MQSIGWMLLDVHSSVFILQQHESSCSSLLFSFSFLDIYPIHLLNVWTAFGWFRRFSVSQLFIIYDY